MIKTETAIAQTQMIEESRRPPGGTHDRDVGMTTAPDKVEISEECKKRLVMSNLKAALSSPDGFRGRYNR